MCPNHLERFSLTQFYLNKRKFFHKKKVQLPQDLFGTSQWPPFHCFGTWITKLYTCSTLFGRFLFRYRKTHVPFTFDKIVVPSIALLYPEYKNNNHSLVFIIIINERLHGRFEIRNFSFRALTREIFFNTRRLKFRTYEWPRSIPHVISFFFWPKFRNFGYSNQSGHKSLAPWKSIVNLSSLSRMEKTK